MTDPGPARLTDAELMEIEARIEAAEYGPWSCKVRFITDKRGRDRAYIELRAEVGPDRPIARFFPQHEDGLTGERTSGSPSSYDAEANCRFAAAARSDVPRLFAEVKRLRALLGSGDIGS